MHKCYTGDGVWIQWWNSTVEVYGIQGFGIGRSYFLHGGYLYTSLTAHQIMLKY